MNRLIRWGASAALVLFSAGAAFAQFGGPGGGGGFQPSPDMMRKIQAWQHWRDNHKNIAALQQTMMGLRQVENDSRSALNKTQARHTLAILMAWRHKPVMSDSQAAQVNRQLTGDLTLTQLKRLATATERRPGGFGGGAGRPGGGFGGGAGRPGGFGGGPGARRPGGFTMPSPRDYNPLNPDSSPFAQGNSQRSSRMLAGYNEFISKLAAAAR